MLKNAEMRFFLSQISGFLYKYNLYKVQKWFTNFLKCCKMALIYCVGYFKFQYIVLKSHVWAD